MFAPSTAPMEVRVSQRRVIALVGLLAACGGSGQPSGPTPVLDAASPEVAVNSFMKAVADSNIGMMGRYWGTSQGPASLTGKPDDYQQRMQVTHLYLRGAPFKILRSEPVADDPKRQVVTVQFDRQSCTRTVPFTTVKTDDHGWIVVGIDLNQAGTPGRPCAKMPPSAGR
jgi:hypothetical protein